MNSSGETRIKLPQWASELFVNDYRYFIAHGGRGGGKSESVVRALLIMGMQEPLRVLCCREFQASISESVHKLLADVINNYGLGEFYTITQTSIKGVNGTEFLFKGIRHNVQEIKGMSGIDVCFVEEAANVSDQSWEILVPTIRKPGSRFIIVFNPKNPTDAVWKRFVMKPHNDIRVRKVLWSDNPFFPEVLNQERLRLLSADPEAYKHVWEGEFDERHSGAVYANTLQAARVAGRICPVPYKSGIPVVTAWDLGKANSTCIWFAQIVGLQTRIIDYHEAYGDDADIPKLAELIRSKPYEYGGHWLPHDARHERLGMKGSISDQLRDLGVPNKIVPSISIEAGIQAGKQLLASAYIDESLTGIEALMHYHYEWDELKQRFKNEPYHDWSSDAADAMRYLAIALDRQPKAKPKADFRMGYGKGAI